MSGSRYALRPPRAGRPVADRDVSISGACIETPARPEFGTEVRLGKFRARVMRHYMQGFDVQLIDIPNPAALRCHFG